MQHINLCFLNPVSSPSLHRTLRTCESEEVKVTALDCLKRRRHPPTPGVHGESRLVKGNMPSDEAKTIFY